MQNEFALFIAFHANQTMSKHTPAHTRKRTHAHTLTHTQNWNVWCCVDFSPARSPGIAIVFHSCLLFQCFPLSVSVSQMTQALAWSEWGLGFFGLPSRLHVWNHSIFPLLVSPRNDENLVMSSSSCRPRREKSVPAASVPYFVYVLMYKVVFG